MRIFKIIIFIGLTLNFFSCDNESIDSKSIDITLTNCSFKRIDLLYFATFDNQSKTIDFSVDSGKQIQLDFMFSNKTKGDGTYFLYFKNFDSIDTLKYSISYFTNGIPMESNLKINILADSIEIIRINREHSVYY